MKLSILIATQGRRNPKFRLLVKELLHQAKAFRGMIEVVAYWNNGELPIGEIRRALLEEAKGDYVCFVDDDDAVPHYYCQEIIRALGRDYVGFKVKLFNEGVEKPPVYHDLQYQVWTEDDNGYYRGVTHLNPIKREIALQGNFSLDGAGEDANWAKSVVGLVSSQKFINKFMYFYHHDKEDSSFGGSPYYRPSGYRRPAISYKYFRYHPNSKLVSKEVEDYVKANS